MKEIFVDKSCRMSYHNRVADNNLGYADMAELADAHGSGPCELTFMGVRISLSAPGKRKPLKSPAIIGISTVFSLCYRTKRVSLFFRVFNIASICYPKINIITN